MSTSIGFGQLLLLSLLTRGQGVATSGPVSSNNVLLDLLLGGGLSDSGSSSATDIDFSNLFSRLMGGSSSSVASLFPDVTSLTTKPSVSSPAPTAASSSAPTPTAPVTTPAAAAADEILSLEEKGTLPAGFDVSNPPKLIKYGGNTYQFVSVNNGGPGIGTSIRYDATTTLANGLNKMSLNILGEGSTSTSSASSSSGSSSSSSGTQYAIGTISPLVFDLNGDGNTDTTAATHQFDIDNDGKLDTINQIASGDGLLVMDDDKDGIVGENAREVFGNFTANRTFANGFDALKAIAKRELGDAAVADDKLDAAEIAALEDKIKFALKVNGEVKSLSGLGISSISLNYDATHKTKDAQGNIQGERSAFTQNGSEKALIDVWFKKH